MNEQPNGAQLQALEVARSMVKAGVPIFLARPNPARPGRYYLPDRWEWTQPDESVIDQWRPGDGLGAVGGWVADFLDVDPRNGGDASVQELMDAGHWPLLFGKQSTPSGGAHFVISPTGCRKETGFMAGLDLQAGSPEPDRDGKHGRAFIWLAPTMGASKAPETLGQLVEYQWVDEPDLEWLTDFQGPDDSVSGIRDRAIAHRERRKSRERVTRDHGPFATATSIMRRDFTQSQAEDFCRRELEELQNAKIGEIEESANRAAAQLSHFVPEFWSVEQAFQILEACLAQTAYDPDGPSDWRAEKFLPVLDGSRPLADDWKAGRRAEAETLSPPVIPDAVVIEGEQSRADWLEGQLVTAADLAALPTPRPLILDYLNLNTESWIIGAPGSFKSFVALDMAGHIGRGLPWQGNRTHQGLVIYIAAEGAQGMVMRTRAWTERYGPMDGVLFLPLPIKVKSADGQWPALVEVCRRRQPVLIVIDTQSRVTTGLEENSNSDMTIYTDAVSALRQATGACVLTVHHTGRNGQDARGASAIDGAQDTELKTVRAEPRSSMSVKIKQDKQKDMAELDTDLELRLQVVALGQDPETGRAVSSLAVLPAGSWETEQGYDVTGTSMDVRPRIPDAIRAGTWKRHLLDILWDQAPSGRGMTVPALYRLLEAEYPDQLRAGAAARTGSVTRGWKALVEMTDSVGDPVVENVGGERWEVTSLEVRAALQAERE